MKLWKISGQAWEDKALTDEYSSARGIGPLRLGDRTLFFRAKRRTYAVPYSDLDRIYRRVMLVPARMCCGRGDLAVEYLVLERAGIELAQIQMPGERAGKAALEELKERAPHAAFTCPPKEQETIS